MNKIVYRWQFLIIFIHLIIIALIISPSSAAAMEGPFVDAVTYYNSAVDAASNGSDNLALELVDKALKIQPDFYLAQVTKAGLLSKEGNHTVALQILDEANRSHPDNPYILAAKASVFINAGQYIEARKNADEAIKHDPTMVDAWILKGTAHGGLGEYENELNASERALKIDPENLNAKSNYNYAVEKIRSQQKNNDQDDVESTPLPLFVVLGALFFAGFFYRNQT